MKPAGRIEFGSFVLDPTTGELWEDGVRLHLQDKPFQLLVALVERPGEVARREDLRSKLWPDHTFVDFDHSINVAVSKLREALGDSAEAPRFIETLPRRGYRFLPAVSGGPSRGPPARDHSPLFWGATLGLLALIGLLLAANAGRHWSLFPGAANPESIQSLAVLPLSNTIHGPDDEYLADGVTTAIIAELAKIQALRVISWQSVVQFRDSEVPLPEIAYLLDVDAIVLGSVSRSGDRIQVNAQLVAADPERHLWAQSFDEDLGDLLDIQQEVARAVAREIRVAVTPEESSRLSDATLVLPEAYDTYLKGLHHWNQFSKTEFLEAIEHFEEAIALDPDYAAAYSALADTWSMLCWYGHVPPAIGFPRAEAAATRALELAPELAAAHNSMAAVLYCYRWNFSAADEEHRQAIRLSPSYALAHNWYSWSLALRGHHDQAIAQIRRAQRLNPLSAAINATVGIRLYDARRYDEAVQQLQLTLEMNRHFYPALLFLGRSYQQLKLHDQAVQVLQEALEASGGAPIYEAALATGLASAGRKEEAGVLLAHLLERASDEYVPAFHVATVLLALDRTDETIDWLERAFQERSPWMSRLSVDPLFDPIREDHRFVELEHRVAAGG